MRLVALDIGGTNTRFALARVGADGAIALEEPITLKTAEYAGIAEAWAEFERRCPGPVPHAAAIAIAGSVAEDRVRMTNSAWAFRQSTLAGELGLERLLVLNDFAAVAHAVAHAPAGDFLHIAGPDEPLPDAGTISVIGPGTGLGVAQLHRGDGIYHVQATEGGHIGFAPVDALDDAILARLRQRLGRVSTERVNAGPGIVEIHAVLAQQGGHPVADDLDDRAIWQRGLAGEDALARAAVEHFCRSLGSVAGDYALVHGAGAVVLAGGVGYRLRHLLPHSGFAERFRAKGRYETLMAHTPVKLITQSQPGLFGAAAAFAMEHRA